MPSNSKTAAIEDVFNETAKAYIQEVEINKYRKYIHVCFGAHTPTDKVHGVSRQLLKRFNEKGAIEMQQLARGFVQSSLPSADAIFALEYYARLRDAFDREGLAPLPELGLSIQLPRFPGEGLE